MRIIKLLFQISKERIFFIALSILIGVLTILSSIGMMTTSSLLISKAALHNEVLALMTLIVGVRFFGISRGVLRYFERIFSHDVTLKILSKIRAWTYKKFNENYFENSKRFYSGDIYTRLVNDIDLLKDFYLRGIYPFIIAVITGILTTSFLCFFNKALAFLFLSFYIITGFIMPIFLYRFNKKNIKYETDLKKQVNKLLIDILNGSLEITIYSLEDMFLSKLNGIFEKYLKIKHKKNIVDSIGDSTNSFFITILTAFSLLLNASIVAKGEMSALWYAAVPLIIITSFEAIIPMSNVFYIIFDGMNAGEDIYSLKAEKSQDKKAFIEKIKNIDISVKKLTVMDKEKRDYILKNISFEVPAGKKLAIVGESGSGKTSILKSLAGFLKYDSGKINVGGLLHSKIDINALRRIFTYVEQEPYMFNTSLLENLLISNIEADLESILKALDSVELKKLIEDLPEKIDTEIEELGMNFSGGEIRRLAIVRALLKPCKVVLLDEPTANLDTRIEKKVISYILNEIRGKSCIWVTHRLIEMDKMDEIIVLSKGEIVERGTHSELIKMESYYYKLWTAQQEFIGE